MTDVTEDTPVIRRFGSQEALEVLHRLAPQDFAAGSVNIIDISIIRDKSAEKWPRRQEQIRDYVMRSFRKMARQTDMLLPLNDVQFLAVQPGAPRHIAAACCGRVALDTMNYFLGAQTSPPISLLVVMGVNSGQIAASPIDENDVRTAMSRDVGALDSGAGARWTEAGRTAGGIKKAAVVIDSVTRSVLRLEPIWSVAQEAVVSYLVAADFFCQNGETVDVAKLADLRPRGALSYALEAIQYASCALKMASEMGTRFAVHIPIPVNALSITNGRHDLIKAFQRLPPGERELIIVEIAQCAAGMPQSRMLEMANVFRPFCRAVIAQVEQALIPPQHWFQTGLSGVSAVIDGSEEDDERDMMRRLRRFADAVVSPRRLVVAHGLRHRGLALSVWAGGFTHISGQVISDLAAADGLAIRLSGADIFVSGPERADAASL